MCQGHWRPCHQRRYALLSFVFFSVLLTAAHRWYLILTKKWTVLAMGSVAYFLQQGSLLVALSQLSATRYVQISSALSPRVWTFSSLRFLLWGLFSVILFSHFSSAWGKTLSSATFVSMIRVSLSLASNAVFTCADCTFYSDCPRPCHLFRLRHSLFLERRSGDASGIPGPSVTYTLNRSLGASQIHVGA